jgi:hypothetical protein
LIVTCGPFRKVPVYNVPDKSLKKYTTEQEDLKKDINRRPKQEPMNIQVPQKLIS